MQIKKQQLELDMELQTGSKSGKEHIKVVFCHPAYLIYMQSTSCEMGAEWITSWNHDCQEKYQITSDVQMTPPLGQKVKKN